MSRGRLRVYHCDWLGSMRVDFCRVCIQEGCSGLGENSWKGWGGGWLYIHRFIQNLSLLEGSLVGQQGSPVHKSRPRAVHLVGGVAHKPQVLRQNPAGHQRRLDEQHPKRIIFHRFCKLHLVLQTECRLQGP